MKKVILFYKIRKKVKKILQKNLTSLFNKCIMDITNTPETRSWGEISNDNYLNLKI